MIQLGFIPELILPIGDMHVRNEDIEEAKKFIVWMVAGVLDMNKKTGKKIVPVFMGDQYHLFAMKTVESEEFWTWAFKYILEMLGYPALALIGNHDMNQQETANGMDVHNNYVVTIGKDGLIVTPSVGAVGFIRNEEIFYAKVMEMYNKGVRRVLAHVEFDGCQFESGYYSPHGFDLKRYPADLFFYSGHVHLRQEFGNIFYFGTPRHLTKSDINEKKGVHVMNLADGSRQFFETPFEVWSPFTKVFIDEASQNLDEALAKIDSLIKLSGMPAKIYVEINGSKDYVKKVENKLPGGVKTNSTYTDEVRKVELRASEGVPATFAKFSVNFFASNGTPPDVQAEVLKRIYEKCPTLKIGAT